MNSCCNIPQSMTSCCSTVDYLKTAAMVESCGFKLGVTAMEAIRKGRCRAVTIGFDDKKGPFVHLDQYGLRKRTYVHPLGKYGTDLVRNKIKSFHPNEEPAKEEEPLGKLPEIIREPLIHGHWK